MKIRSTEMLLRDHPVLSWIASSALLSFMCVAFLVSLECVSLIDLGEGYPVIFFLGVTLLGGAFCMLCATFHVIRKWRELDDQLVFLLVTWAIPYMGVALILGGPRLIRSLRSRGG